MSRDDKAGALLSLEEALAWREELRAAGRQLVFTNGCFDLLHAGHARLLEAAAAQGDALIVGLNDDTSVRRLKGPSRPLLPQGERALLLGALRAVDRVVLFADDTPARVVQTLLPDVLVKGADWAEDAIVGADLVRAAGGRVVRVELVEGRSTSALIERLRSSGEQA